MRSETQAHFYRILTAPDTKPKRKTTGPVTIASFPVD
jgi:hypothetical protein